MALLAATRMLSIRELQVHTLIGLEADFVLDSEPGPAYFAVLALTRQTTLPTSSATSSAPRLSIATPTGRP